jgi:hypothetical protein
MAIGDDAVVHRLRFMGRVIVSGLRWARELVDQVLLLVGLLALTVGVAVGGVLLNRPAVFLGGFAGVALLAILGEGAYRVSSEQQRVAAEPDADALWLSEQLFKGNDLLAQWGEHVSREVEQRLWPEAATWEQETRDGLVARIPAYAGHFGVDVGLGYEFAQFALETRERTRLRRRIQRLAEIMERYERGRGA